MEENQNIIPDDKKVKKPKSKTSRIILITISIILLILFLPDIIYFFNDIFGPDPVIISKGIDEWSSDLFEYSQRVWAEIRNYGNSGDVIIEATIYQGGNSWTKTNRLYMSKNLTKRYYIVFDEVELLGGDVTVRVIAY